MKKTYFFATILILVFIAVVNCSNAQKLPNKQEGSMRAPANIKIDGKTTEWNNQFKAYNKATEVYYTIANDDNNLYFTLQAASRTIISKIMNGGITFAVVTPGKKTKDAMSITFPVFEQNNKPASAFSKADIQSVSTTAANYSDSVVSVNNKRLAAKSKLIMVTGIKGVDTVISVYNADGIKTAQAYDNKLAYTYELSVSLKQLGLSIANPQKFAYHITLNGVSMMPVTDIKVAAKKGTFQIATAPPLGSDLSGMKIMADNQSTAPTDFWGEYTLAKK